MNADSERPGDGRAPEIIDASADSADTLDTATAAELLGLSERTVRRHLASGLLSGHRVDGTFGKEWRVTAASVELLIAERAEKERGRADTRRPSDRPAIRTDSAVMRRLDVTAEALIGVLDALAAVRALTTLPDELHELGETIRENTEGQAAGTAAMGRLIDELVAARADRDALADELRRARETIDELTTGRRRWWHRLRIGRSSGT